MSRLYVFFVCVFFFFKKMTTSGKNGYRYEKFVSYEKSFSLGHGAFGKATVIMDKTSQASFVKKKVSIKKSNSSKHAPCE